MVEIYNFEYRKKMSPSPDWTELYKQDLSFLIDFAFLKGLLLTNPHSQLHGYAELGQKKVVS